MCTKLDILTVTDAFQGTSNNLETLMETMKKIKEESQSEVTREEMDRRFEVEKEEASHGFELFSNGMHFLCVSTCYSKCMIMFNEYILLYLQNCYAVVNYL